MSKRRVMKSVKGKNGKRISRAYWVNDQKAHNAVLSAAARFARPRGSTLAEMLFGTSHLPAETRMQMAQMQYNLRRGRPAV